ncbi:MAG TPA: hypothetical protein VF169_12745 [Albitalea sp.]|uniref:hypothetical protein n=1 Tax=Piscinibacter sp. TaxID=1903157 RepID=UPI002ECFD928
MASCAYCSTTILFGGTREGDLRFCNAKCQANGTLSRVATQLPREDVERYLGEVHRGNCPQCRGDGPVDLHTSYRVWSAVFLTQWSSRPAVCCKRCGTKRKIGDMVFSLVLGWWGLPWGLLMTPVQLGRNLVGAFRTPDPSRPSPALEKVLRLQLAAGAMAARQRAEASLR